MYKALKNEPCRKQHCGTVQSWKDFAGCSQLGTSPFPKSLYKLSKFPVTIAEVCMPRVIQFVKSGCESWASFSDHDTRRESGKQRMNFTWLRLKAAFQTGWSRFSIFYNWVKLGDDKACADRISLCTQLLNCDATSVLSRVSIQWKVLRDTFF